jgi:hypothetical protein
VKTMTPCCYYCGHTNRGDLGRIQSHFADSIVWACLDEHCCDLRWFAAASARSAGARSAPMLTVGKGGRGEVAETTRPRRPLSNLIRQALLVVCVFVIVYTILTMAGVR